MAHNISSEFLLASILKETASVFTFSDLSKKDKEPLGIHAGETDRIVKYKQTAQNSFVIIKSNKSGRFLTVSHMDNKVIPGSMFQFDNWFDEKLLKKLKTECLCQF